MRLQMRFGLRDRPRPLETPIAVARCNGEPRHRRPIKSGPVTVKLHGAKAINPTVAPPGHLGAHHVAAVRIGPLPIRDMDHAAIEFKLGHEGLPPAPRHTPLYHLNAKV